MPSTCWTNASQRHVSSVTSAMSSTSMRPKIVHSRLAKIVTTRRRHRGMPRPITMRRRSASCPSRVNTAIPVKVSYPMKSFLELPINSIYVSLQSSDTIRANAPMMRPIRTKLILLVVYTRFVPIRQRRQRQRETLFTSVVLRRSIAFSMYPKV